MANNNEKKLNGTVNTAFRYADCCVFQTSDAKNYFPKSVQEKGIIIANPISSEKLPDPCDLGDREKLVLAVGRIVPQKNFLMLIKAWELIENKFPEYVLHIYGDKTYRDHVWDYFNSIHNNEGILTELYFRDKEKNGWPGDLKLVQKNTTKVLPKKMRSQVKLNCLG